MLEALLKDTAKFCEAEGLIPKATGVLVACSGGPDSLALLDILWRLSRISRYDFTVEAAHFEHGIRVEDGASKADAAFVADFCEARGIPCAVAHGDVPAYAQEKKLSLETAARQCRYEFLEATRKGRGLDVIATAHQADDLIIDVVNDVKVLSKSMTRISKHPEYYNERTIADPLKDKILSGQAYILYSNEEIAQDKALRHEIGIASTIQDEMVNIALTYKPHRVSVYAASEHGYFLTVDIMPDDGPSDEMDGTHIFEARERTWYLAAKKADKLVFSDVYTDYVTGKPCITCGAPYYDANGFAGVLGFGMYLDVWHDVLMDPTVNPYPCFVLTDKGEVVVSSHPSGDLTVSTGNDIRKALSGNMAKAAAEMVDKKSGVRYVEVNGIPYYLAFAPLKTIGWSLGILTPVDVVHDQADGVREMFLNMLKDFQTNVDASYHHFNLILAAALLVVLMLLLILSHVLAKQFVRPIHQLTTDVQDIAKGNLEKKIDVHTGDEIELLAKSFNTMTRELQEYIANLTKITADKERIATELNVASQIQFSMLPNDFTLGSGRFDMFASMVPAKTVGGDFYDFYMLDENHLAFVIADVSGKGIPAALFMAAAKNCLKLCLLSMEDPDELEKAVIMANERLCENNDQTFFVTVFLGVLDLRSGLLRFVNAGHNPPLARINGKYQYLDMKRDLLWHVEGHEIRERALMKLEIVESFGGAVTADPQSRLKARNLRRNGKRTNIARLRNYQRREIPFLIAQNDARWIFAARKNRRDRFVRLADNVPVRHDDPPRVFLG